MQRRDFLRYSAAGAAAAAVAGTSDIAKAAERISSLGEEPEGKPLLASAPMLQNFAETSIGVAFAVNDLANGYVRRLPARGHRRPGDPGAHHGPEARHEVLLSNRRGPHPLRRRLRHESAGQRGGPAGVLLHDRRQGLAGQVLRHQRHARALARHRRGTGQDRGNRAGLRHLERRRLQYGGETGEPGQHLPGPFAGAEGLCGGDALSLLPGQPRFPRPGEPAPGEGLDVPAARGARRARLGPGPELRRPDGRDGPRGPGHGRGQAGHESPVRRPVQERRVPRGADGLAPGRPEAAGNRLRALSRGLLPHPALRRRPFAQSRRRGPGRYRSALYHRLCLLAAHLRQHVGTARS